MQLGLENRRALGFGRIIAVVSPGVIQPIPNLGISNTVRLALVGWAKTLASEVASRAAIPVHSSHMTGGVIRVDGE